MYCKLVFDVPLDRDFDYRVPEALRAQVKAGVRVTAPFGPVLTTGLVTEVSDHTDVGQNVLMKEIKHVLDERPVFGSDLFALAAFMKEKWGGALGQILFSLVPPQAYFKLAPAAPAPLHFDIPDFELLPAQQKALARIEECLEGGHARLLLSGPACAGKTEIVLRAAQQVLEQYGQCLITLPDVLAAQQFAQQQEKRFGAGNVFCWHARMPLSQKKKIFSHISGGLPCVVVSVRSGALLPFKNLRLAAMLDEENENYKQEENKPYFHTRDLLCRRCLQHEALLLCVSDTPSLETLQAVQKGQAEEIRLPQPVPQCHYRAQVKVTGKKGEHSKLLSDFLLQELKENLAAKKAALLILNRRGYSNAYYCLNCGAYAKCPACKNILAREKTPQGEDRLVCKKCGHHAGLEQTCPECQNKIFKSRGGGTQKIVSEINRLFPSARVLRLDSDTLKHKSGQGYAVRRALQDNAVDVVIGTHQALWAASAPQVTLAAVLDGDLELDNPDFRASEKFGQLLFKLKNRLSTRRGGRLIIQASSAQVYDFDLLQEDYIHSARQELQAREMFDYPPCAAFIKVLLKVNDEALLQQETQRLCDTGRPLSKEILGPVRTGKKTDALKKQYLLFKTTPADAPALLKRFDEIKPAKKTDLRVLADPYDFY